MVKGKPHSEVRWRQGRIGLRIHTDLRDALEFLAAKDHRPLSNYVEMILLQAARERLANGIDDYGEREDDRPWVRRIDVEIVHPMHKARSNLGDLPKRRK
jgi:hypothetical protein